MQAEGKVSRVPADSSPLWSWAQCQMLCAAPLTHQPEEGMSVSVLACITHATLGPRQIGSSHAYAVVCVCSHWWGRSRCAYGHQSSVVARFNRHQDPEILLMYWMLCFQLELKPDSSGCSYMRRIEHKTCQDTACQDLMTVTSHIGHCSPPEPMPMTCTEQHASTA